MTIRDRRKALGLNQTEAACLAQVSLSQANRIERGLEPLTPMLAERFAAALACDPAALMRGHREMADALRAKLAQRAMAPLEVDE